MAKLGLNQSELPKIDEEFEAITEGEELTRKEKLKTKWAALEALVGNPKRIDLVAADLVQHYERRLEAMEGKAMIVCMSRRICVEMYNAIIKLRPDWESIFSCGGFQSSQPRNVREIINKFIGQLNARLREQNLQLTLEESVYSLLMEKGYSAEFGARPMERTIEQLIAQPLAKAMIDGRIKSGDSLIANVSEGAIMFNIGAEHSEA